MLPPLNDIRYLYGQDLIEEIIAGLDGRLCLEDGNCNLMAWAVAISGNGDHLEIGTLHGGSAILAAMVKRDLGLSGDVWCVDPFDGYYVGTPFACEVDWVSKIPVTMERVLKNAAHFGVADRIKLIQAKSDPWPAGLPDRFSSAYIDGDHWGDAPLKDWLNVKARTTQSVVFDNVNRETHIAVAAAVDVARADPEWDLIVREGITAILHRVGAGPV